MVRRRNGCNRIRKETGREEKKKKSKEKKETYLALPP